jgi:hypothetical protein
MRAERNVILGLIALIAFSLLVLGFDKVLQALHLLHT